MDTLLYDYSIPAISGLQQSLGAAAPFMQLMSTVFDPKYAFLIYSPLAYLLEPRVGKQLIMTTVIAEWLNQVLKWLLHGERPYWYVHSSGHFDPEQTPIKQFPITCELGPGHPSGHAMVTGAVWYVVLAALLEAYANWQRQTLDLKLGLGPRAAAWSAYATLLALVSVSRVFLGCHFPHQCLAGAALGLLLAKWISSQEIKAEHFVVAAGALFTTAFGTFALLQALGFDPSWTIKLATTHCAKREYIHLDTAPFFSIMRYCGFALGCGLGLLLPLKRDAINQLVAVPAAADGESAPVADAEDLKDPLSSRNLLWMSFKLVMALLMARLVDNLGFFVSHSNLTLFYSSAFAAYTLFSYAIVNL